MIVLDASAAIDVILNIEPRASRLRERLTEETDEGFHVPHFFDLEVLSSLRRHTLSGFLNGERAQTAVERLLSMRLIRYSHASLIGRIWELGNNVTACDASYIALAETLGATLVTIDGKLARSSGHSASIEVFD